MRNLRHEDGNTHEKKIGYKSCTLSVQSSSNATFLLAFPSSPLPVICVYAPSNSIHFSVFVCLSVFCFCRFLSLILFLKNNCSRVCLILPFILPNSPLTLIARVHKVEIIREDGGRQNKTFMTNISSTLSSLPDYSLVMKHNTLV